MLPSEPAQLTREGLRRAVQPRREGKGERLVNPPLPPTVADGHPCLVLASENQELHT